MCVAVAIYEVASLKRTGASLYACSVRAIRHRAKALGTGRLFFIVAKR